MKPNSKTQSSKSALLAKIATVLPRMSNDPTIRFVEYVMSDITRKYNFIAAYDVYLSQASFIQHNIPTVKSRIVLNSLVQWYIRSFFIQVITSMYAKCDVDKAAEMMSARADSIVKARKKD